METGIQESKVETRKTDKGNEYEVYRTPNPEMSGSGFSTEAMESRTTMINDAVERGIVTKEMGNLLKSYLAPKSHSSHMKLNDCVKEYFPGQDVTKVRNQALSACKDILENLWYGELHENEKRAREADEKNHANKSRTREEIQKHKAMAEAEKNARKKLGIPSTVPFLALSPEDQQRLSTELGANHVQCQT